MDPVALGEVMRAVTVGVVEASNAPDWPVGAHVLGFGGVAEYYVGIPGVNVLYKAGDNAGLPLTAVRPSPSRLLEGDQGPRAVAHPALGRRICRCAASSSASPPGTAPTRCCR